MEKVLDEACTDSDDEWYSQMEQAVFSVEPEIEQMNAAVDNTCETTETEESYFERMNTINSTMSDCIFQSEKSSVWYKLMQQSLKYQQEILEKRETINDNCNGYAKLSSFDTVATSSVCNFLFGNLPKSNSMYEIVSNYSRNHEAETTVFVDHLLHPSIVIAVYVDTIPKCLEVSFYASISSGDINFSALSYVVTHILKETGLTMVKFTAFESEMYDVFRTQNSTLNEIWVERCELYANADGVKVSDVEPIRLHPDYAFHDLSEVDADIINSTWKYRTDHSIHMVKAMISTQRCVGIRHTRSSHGTDSQLVAWCLIYRNGALGMLYTLENHRKKGLASAVVRELLRRSQASSDLSLCRTPPFCYIEGNNEASKALFCGQLGFTRQADVLWVGLKSNDIDLINVK